MAHRKSAILLAFLVWQASPRYANSTEPYTTEGFSSPVREANLAFGASGVLRFIDARDGDQVVKGQVLARLDNSSQAAAIAVAKARSTQVGELQAARSDYRLKKNRLSMVKQLLERGHSTSDEQLQRQAEFSLAEAKLATVTERRTIAELEWRQLVAESETLILKAPFDGVIMGTKREVGEFVSPVDPGVMTLVDSSSLIVEFDVAETQATKIRVTSEVTVQFPAGPAKGIVEFVSPYPHGETNTRRVKVVVDNQDQKRTAGQLCVLTIPAR